MASITNSTGAGAGRSRGLKLAVAVLLFAAAAAAVRVVAGEHLEPKAALALLRSVEDQWWAPPAFLSAYLAGTGLFLPAVAFHMVSGATWGFAVGLVLNFAAVNGSASLHFLLARRLGRARVERWFPGRRLALFDGAATRHGFRAVVAIRMLPLPHAAVNIAAGVSAMRWKDFALGSMVGTLPMLLVYTYFAAALVEGVGDARGLALWHSAIAGSLVLLFTFLPRLIARLRRKAAVQPAAPANP